MKKNKEVTLEAISNLLDSRFAAYDQSLKIYLNKRFIEQEKILKLDIDARFLVQKQEFERYVGVIFEEFQGRLKAGTELIPRLSQDVSVLKEDVSELKSDMKIVKNLLKIRQNAVLQAG